MKKKTIVIIILLISLLGGNFPVICKEQKTNQAKPAQLKSEDYRLKYINIHWWEKFNDPILKDYILKTISNNHDLKIATLKVLEMQANVQESFGKELPSVDIASNYMRMRITKNLFPEGFSGMESLSLNVFTMPLTANYELDLLRKKRDATLGTKKQLEAVVNEEKAAYISLVTLTATTYFNLLKTDKAIEYQHEIITLRKKIFEITKERNAYGLSPTSDVVLDEKSLTEAENSLKDLEKNQHKLLNQLAVITGESVANSLNLKRASIEKIKPVADLPESIPPELILERPDILKAESTLQKAKIDVSIARKDFFPTFNISGTFGFASSTLKRFFNWESYLASLSAGIAQSLFTGGQKKARLKAKKYKYEQMFETYQKSILAAFQEVNDSLVSIKIDTEKNNNNLKRLELGNKHFDIIQARYEEGDISYFETIQHQELLTWLKIEQLQTKTDCLVDSLSLYKALGANIK